MHLLDGLAPRRTAHRRASRTPGPRSPATPYASRAATIADGPQPPLWLSRRLSHSPIRDASSFWKASVSGALPHMSSTICVPATAHHSWSNSSLMKWFSGCLNRFTSTFTRAGVGFGVGVGAGVGADGSTDPAGVGGRRRGRRGELGGSRRDAHDRGDRPVGRRVDEELDPARDAVHLVADAEGVRRERRRSRARRARWRWRAGGGREGGDGRGSSGHSGAAIGRRRDARGPGGATHRARVPSAALRAPPATAAGQAAGREVDRSSRGSPCCARLVAGDRLLHGGAHGRDLLGGVELQRDHVIVRLQPRERLSNFILALERGELARRERTFARFRRQFFDLRGTNSHRRCSSWVQAGGGPADHAMNQLDGQSGFCLIVHRRRRFARDLARVHASDSSAACSRGAPIR